VRDVVLDRGSARWAIYGEGAAGAARGDDMRSSDRLPIAGLRYPLGADAGAATMKAVP
jgi:hypothetical protein